MKPTKSLRLLVMAAASLMAFTSSASATPVLTSPAGTEYTGEIHATMVPGTSSIMKAIVEDTCTATTLMGTISINNTTQAAGAATAISNGTASTPCSKDTTTLTGGELTINDKGEVFAINNEITVKDTGINQSCVYGGGASPGTNMGTLIAGAPAKLKVSTTKLKRISGSGLFCASEGTLTAEYVVTTPTSLFVT